MHKTLKAGNKIIFGAFIELGEDDKAFAVVADGCVANVIPSSIIGIAARNIEIGEEIIFDSLKNTKDIEVSGQFPGLSF